MQVNPGSIGRYQILRELGQGAMGIVFLAQDPSLKRKVAIKCMKERAGQNQSVLVRFQREAETSSKLNHPNVITIYDVGEDPEMGPFMAMEYVEGSSLASLIERGALSKEAGYHILTQVMYGLLAAGNAGIIHRDVKPENILVAHDGRVKLMDFGIAKGDESRLTTTGMVVGTPSYTAPELLLGKDASYHTDLYAFSVTAFEVLTGGQLPYSGDSLGVTLYRIVHEAPTFPADLAPALARVFEKALQKTPSQRHTNLPEFMTELAGALGFAPPILPSEGFAPPPLPASAAPAQRASQDDIRTGYVPSSAPARQSQSGHPPADPGAMAPPPDLFKHGQKSGTELPTRTPTHGDPGANPALIGVRRPPPAHAPKVKEEKDFADTAKLLIGATVVIGLGLWGWMQYSANQTRMISVTTEPPDAHVLIDGQEVGTAPLTQQVKASARLLGVWRSDYVSQELPLPEGDQTIPVKLKLKPGFIRVKTSPSSAKVVVDGVPIVASTPIWSIEVGNKKVHLEVYKQGYETWSQFVSDTEPPPETIVLKLK